MAIGAGLLALAKGLASGIGRGLGWLVEKPVRLLVAALALVLAWQTAIVVPSLQQERDDALLAASNEVAAHRQTKEDYRLAQAEAARLDRQRLVRVEAEQKEITDEVVETFEVRLADAQRRAGNLAEQLRRQARAGKRPPGPGDRELLPGAGNAAGGADEAADDHGLPPGRSAAERLERDLVATEQALQLDALIDWVERQARVQVNAEGASEDAR